MDSNIGFIPSKATLLKKKPDAEFQAVVFESYKSKNPRKPQKKHDEISAEKEDDKRFNIRHAKREVIKFGISGFDSQKKEEAKINLLIKLGAKPPKNKGKNYKLLQTERKNEKLKQAERANFQQLGKNNIGRSNAKGKSFDRKRRKGQGDILGVYGKAKVAKKQDS